MLTIRKDIARRIAGSTVATVVLLFASGAACAGTTETAARMPLGAAATAPAGFLDFCRRSPGDCSPASGERTNLNDIRARASSLYWAGVFGAQDGARSRFTASTAGRGFDWGRVFPQRATTPAPLADPMREGMALAMEDVAVPAVAMTAVSHDNAAVAASAADFGVDVVANVPSRPFAKPAVVEAAPVLVMDKARWKQLRSINRDVNRAIRRGSDDRIHGVADYWNAPQGRDARGDCEDYVLAKRRALIVQGFAAETLSIAIVTTSWGESHAVLLVATDEGEMVLDNLTPRISRWDRVNYRWGERQAPGKVFDWVRMAG